MKLTKFPEKDGFYTREYIWDTFGTRSNFYRMLQLLNRKQRIYSYSDDLFGGVRITFNLKKR